MGLDFDPMDQIPTDDADAALRFCRSLVRQLRKESAAETELANSDNADSQVSRSGQKAAVPELSVVIPVYNEEENITVLFDRLVAALEGANLLFEIVFVDDGSHDGSVQKLNEIAASDTRIVVVELARNFGHQVAITAGLDFARGRAVAVMDADLQDPPEVLPNSLRNGAKGTRSFMRCVSSAKKDGSRGQAIGFFIA